MRQNGYITDRDYALAVEVAADRGQEHRAVARGALLRGPGERHGAEQVQAIPTCSPTPCASTPRSICGLQRAAAEAIRLGMQNVDEQIRRQRRFRGQIVPEPQVALVAIDPHTGEVKALAGGRNYGMSQLNHVLAKRQPGSIFKPFVYAAAMDTAVEGGPRILTAQLHGERRAHHLLVRTARATTSPATSSTNFTAR